MFIVIEISRPFQRKPGYYHSSITIFRFYWLWFSISAHHMRYDEMLNLALSGSAKWEASR
jgi:hypothetical protein